MNFYKKKMKLINPKMKIKIKKSKNQKKIKENQSFKRRHMLKVRL